MLALVLTGCGGSDDTSQTGAAPPTACAPGDRELDDGSCLAPGVPADGCPAGFEHDGDAGCVASVPSEPCPDGLVALPGDTECRPLVPCPAGAYPEMGDGAVVHYVDGTYGGGDGDGSQAKPWPTLHQAVAAAPPKAIIAIAGGSYAEAVTLEKPLTLWGACPQQVQIVGPSDGSAITVRTGATGSVVRGLALTGPMSWPALAVVGVEDVLIQEVWVHDTATVGIYADSGLGPTAVVVRDVLVERTGDIGIQVHGARADVERAAIRFVAPGTTPNLGRGINVEAHQLEGNAAQATVGQCIIEHVQERGLHVGSATVAASATLVRDIGADTSDPQAGRGVSAQSGTHRAALSLEGLVIERTRQSALLASAADLTVTNTTVRDIFPSPVDGYGGGGYFVQEWPDFPGATRSHAALSGCLIERTYAMGMVVLGSDLVAVHTVVRDVAPAQNDQRYGEGVHAQDGIDGTERGWLELGWSRVERTHTAGLMFFGASGSVHDALIAEPRPRAADDAFGDGIVVASRDGLDHVDVSHVVVEDAGRAGLGIFSASAALAQSQLRCNPIDLNAESDHSPYVLDDLGGNRCGCGEASGTCKVTSVGLEPPPALEP